MSDLHAENDQTYRALLGLMLEHLHMGVSNNSIVVEHVKFRAPAHLRDALVTAMEEAEPASPQAENDAKSHPRCTRPSEHVCQKPSGRTCIERGCDSPAGTLWGPLWCPEHDADRLDNVSRGMESLLAPSIPAAQTGPDQ